MKKSDIVLLIALVLTGYIIALGIMDLHSQITQTSKPEEVSSVLKSVNHYGVTNDAVEYHVNCDWYVNHSINEDQILDIELLIRRTISKSFQYYSHADIVNNLDSITIDLRNRIQDCIFAIEPSGFEIIHINIKQNTLF